MPQTVIKITKQDIELYDITNIIFTDIVQAPTGDWAREFRFFGTPGENESGNPEVIVIKVFSQSKDALELTTANLQI